MPDAAQIALFILASAVLLITPGPAVLYIVARSVNQGRRAGLVSVCAIEVGNCMHVIAATLGLSALLLSSALAFSIVSQRQPVCAARGQPRAVAERAPFSRERGALCGRRCVHRAGCDGGFGRHAPALSPSPLPRAPKTPCRPDHRPCRDRPSPMMIFPGRLLGGFALRPCRRPPPSTGPRPGQQGPPFKLDKKTASP